MIGIGLVNEPSWLGLRCSYHCLWRLYCMSSWPLTAETFLNARYFSNRWQIFFNLTDVCNFKFSVFLNDHPHFNTNSSIHFIHQLNQTLKCMQTFICKQYVNFISFQFRHCPVSPRCIIPACLIITDDGYCPIVVVLHWRSHDLREAIFINDE